MLGTRLEGRDPLRILCLGAHSDDIEIGAGGTLLTVLRRYPSCEVAWVVLSAAGERAREARASAADFLEGAAAVDVRLGGFRDGLFPSDGEEIRRYLEPLKDLEPDLIFTHTLGDRHQDHRLVSELSWNLFREHLILEYEIPKYDGDLGRPNVFVPLDDDVRQRKIELLITHFASQRSKRWYDEETFLALLRLRGVESQTRYAEAFHGRKLILG